MFRIIKLASQYSLPQNYKAYPKIKDFNSGVIARFKAFDGEVCVDVCNSRTIPIGIIDDIKNDNFNSIGNSNRITVWSCFGVYETDQFDVRVSYKEKDQLYCSNAGLFTTKKSNNGIVLGYVEEAPNARNPILTFCWNLTYNDQRRLDRL